MYKRLLSNANTRYSWSGAARQLRRPTAGLAVSSGALAAYLLWQTQRVYNDVALAPTLSLKQKQPEIVLVPGGTVGDAEELRTVVWGSNKSSTLTSQDIDNFRTPVVAEWLDGVALRDLAIQQSHAACVDARGDVYQWGTGHTEKEHKPALTLRGKNIVQLKLTEGRVYALSASGKLYALSSDAAKQDYKAGRPTPASDSWWGTGWLWGEDETVDFVEIAPHEKLSRTERIVSIDAGTDHLLAVTSSGRTYAHPISKLANTNGQLGFRKFIVPDPKHAHDLAVAHTHQLEVELVPRSIADPLARASRSVRLSPVPTMTENLQGVDDSRIRFCPYMFEIPSLKGVEIEQVACGERSSFARTKTGRVVGWGANEYGQLGLGNDAILDSVTVPTEVVFGPASQARYFCTDVASGGNLTAFTVERTGRQGAKTFELLMCGNGQWGGLGNNLFSSSQGIPLHAKKVSGLIEFNDDANAILPIPPKAITISSTGHVLLTLDTGRATNVGGRDLVVWGKNYDSELGNGKKSSSPIPTTLETVEGGRFMLKDRQAKEVKDLHGKVWKKGVQVQQTAVTGPGSSAVYWKIV